MTVQFDHNKYRPFTPIALSDRRWPDKVIQQAPSWCSVDLRDGNQALIEPMTVEQKSQLFDLLLEVGFKEIEVGFPAASQQDFDFVRMLIDEGRIPDDVTIQILTQARESLIARSFEALKGVRRAIVHLYNSTSTVQREQVFKQDREGIKAIAVVGAQWVKAYAAKQPETEWQFQYSPESFTDTELDYAVEVCNAVNAVWQPTPDKPVIINLPATVEVSTPNIYADQIEWFGREIECRDSIIISLHTHNDRGCAVAAAELGMMAGAQRIEGTLLGNGERTGNMDIVTMAMNLYSQGVDPKLDLANADKILQVVKNCTQMSVHPRHPYVGELVYTAFSGSHQDAINKCLANYQPGDLWQVAYLPIDPRDMGRSYEEVIRINSQSGKGGIAYLLDYQHGIKMPRWLQIDFSRQVQAQAERTETEVSAEQVWRLFQDLYLHAGGRYQLESFNLQSAEQDSLQATVLVNGEKNCIKAEASGVLAAFVNAVSEHSGLSIDVLEYSEHAMGQGVKEQAVVYMQIKCNGERLAAVAMSADIVAASMKAVLAAVNRSEAIKGQQAA
ncbi:MAG: 2-isopropylmalate synthase [Pseudomonadales bacterium]